MGEIQNGGKMNLRFAFTLSQRLIGHNVGFLDPARSYERTLRQKMKEVSQRMLNGKYMGSKSLWQHELPC